MNLPEISENLIEQLNHGNTKAFDKIYHTYYLYLCAIAVYYVHDKRVAGEIVNDVFVAFGRIDIILLILLFRICGVPFKMRASVICALLTSTKTDDGTDGRNLGFSRKSYSFFR